ncbi:hypothetical protein [Roseovarius indicus]|uniref:Uncharacterized protein n=1 Tax=Roseovarius indicus TaxID=540747 RepID=A0A0T5PFF3_9RHOB|nr:hypothetical protein [Roseovarius indicus]KRS19759.1 hypothetical protein XM52_02715 [Roseovarius indicus]QEW28885.1 hypothetical protein RIdsm_04725 [Roseovarius indicus]SFD83068.1 hypothetical protein SAMN04488031_102777 [Roseovarius indicus]
MPRLTHNVVCKARSYAGEDGITRNACQTIGAAWPDENGQLTRIRLYTVPVSWNGTLLRRLPQRSSSCLKTV